MRVLLTGGNGMLGSAILRQNSRSDGLFKIVAPGRKELDLTDYAAVHAFFRRNSFDMVIHAAAKVGGIAANVADPANYLSQNLALNLAVIEGAASSGVPHLLNIGSSCMYPKDHRQPLVEGDLLQAPLEPTNEAYALAKIVAARHCDYLSRTGKFSYRTIIPCNLYGPGDNYSPEDSHLVASIIAKTHRAKAERKSTISIWGDGSVRREFLYVEDLSEWIVSKALGNIAGLPPYLNVGQGDDRSVEEYYRIGAEVIGYEGEFVFDSSKPSGMRQKLMDSSLARTDWGWRPNTSVHEGIASAYRAYLAQLH